MLQIVLKYPELSMSKVWKVVKQNSELIDYFLDYNNDQLPELDFMFKAIGTFIQQILKSFSDKSKFMMSSKVSTNEYNSIKLMTKIKAKIIKSGCKK